jgi:hypothetical protein
MSAAHFLPSTGRLSTDAVPLIHNQRALALCAARPDIAWIIETPPPATSWESAMFGTTDDEVPLESLHDEVEVTYVSLRSYGLVTARHVSGATRRYTTNIDPVGLAAQRIADAVYPLVHPTDGDDLAGQVRTLATRLGRNRIRARSGAQARRVGSVVTTMLSANTISRGIS